MPDEILRYWGPVPDTEVCGDCGRTRPHYLLTHDETGPVCAHPGPCKRAADARRARKEATP